jgi:hypothetical protein
VKVRATEMHREASKLSVALSIYKAYVYIVSASSSILGLLSLEVFPTYLTLSGIVISREA